jgi:hypothetical protein
MREQRPWLLCRVLLLLVVVRAGLWLLPFARLRGLLDTWVPHTGPTPVRPSATEIASAVVALGRRVPGTTCLVEALTADLLLRRYGYPSEVRIGVRRSAERPPGLPPLAAHAWVECGATVIVGALPTLGEYAVLDSLQEPRDRQR